MKKVSLALIVLAVFGFLALFALSSPFYLRRLADFPSPPSAPYVVPALTKPYQNETYRFSLKMPADFSAQEMIENQQNQQDDTLMVSGKTIVFQNQSGDGIQIVITPWDEDGGGYTLTKERILQDVPDMQIRDEQPVDIGENYHGLAFKSDNEAFNGDCASPKPCAEAGSREVWFVFRGNLYQISTYARLDALLQAIFKTWQFE